MNRRPPLPEDMKELRRLVRDGKLFAVQKWIAEGKRTKAPESDWSSPLEIAVDTGFHSMVELLLQQGVNKEERNYMLERAVGDGNFELIKLLVQYLKDLFTRLPAAMITEIKEFTPVAWAKAKAKEKMVAPAA
jgi:hypothetical protein